MDPTRALLSSPPPEPAVAAARPAIMAIRRTLLGLVVLIAACSPATESPPPAESSGEWREPASYTFTLESSCGERSLLGRFGVTVEDGVAVAVEPLDGMAARVPAETLDTVPTLGGLIALAVSARQKGADRVVLASDPGDGHPVSLEIDWAAGAIDDEECYRVLEYVPAIE